MEFWPHNKCWKKVEFLLEIVIFWGKPHYIRNRTNWNRTNWGIPVQIIVTLHSYTYVLSSFSDYFFSDSEDTGCIDCGICVVHAGNNDFGCWQYTTADNNFRCLPSEPEMSEFPEIESLNTRSRWSTYAIKNDVEKTCQIEAETKFNNLTCLQVNFYQIMLFYVLLEPKICNKCFF